MISQSNLSRLANRLAKAGGRRIPESVLERDYCLSWLLAGLSKSPVRDRLIFKGGTALKKCYFPDYRFSEDLDFTLAEEVPFETIRKDLGPKEAAISAAFFARPQRFSWRSRVRAYVSERNLSE